MLHSWEPATNLANDKMLWMASAELTLYTAGFREMPWGHAPKAAGKKWHKFPHFSSANKIFLSRRPSFPHMLWRRNSPIVVGPHKTVFLAVPPDVLQITSFLISLLWLAVFQKKRMFCVEYGCQKRVWLGILQFYPVGLIEIIWKTKVLDKSQSIAVHGFLQLRVISYHLAGICRPSLCADFRY